MEQEAALPVEFFYQDWSCRQPDFLWLYVLLAVKTNKMNKYLILMLLIQATISPVAGNPVVGQRPESPDYVIIPNPTVRNMETVLFLVRKGIFRVDTAKIRFLGVYHKEQAYDFSQSYAYLETDGGNLFDIEEASGELDAGTVYGENGCSGFFREIFRKSAGVIFLGGPDIQPALYGEENRYSEVTDPVRHLFEVSYAFHLLGGSRNTEFEPFLKKRPGYLVTGFCLGLQTMNVASGGSLYQDIPAQLYGKFTPEETLKTERKNLHRNYWQLISDDKQLMGINFHPIRFTNHPFFGKTIRGVRKTEPLIYSSHHQSPAKIGTGFEITALSPDGKVVEGVAHSAYPHVFAVQFHPEVPALYEEMELWKFSPDDQPESYYRIIGEKSVRFHRKYWNHISRCLEKSDKSANK